MAIRKKNEEQGAEDQQTENRMEDSQQNAAPVPESEAGEASLPAGNTQAPDAPQDQESSPPPPDCEVSQVIDTAGEDSPLLEKLNVLADRFRVPSWQQAALLRYTGWMDDKLVTEEEYRAELESLKNRRIGGGRR